MTDRKFNPLALFFMIGPALIVASVVLGPGSILTASKVGCEFGFQMLWVLALSGFLMVATVMLAAWIGVSFEKSFCTEIANRLGRPFAVLIGLIVFGIVACFQSSNNLAILFAFEPFFEGGKIPFAGKILILLLLNGLLVAVILGFKKIYKPIERSMMILVGLMLVGFAANFFVAKVSLFQAFAGLLPSFPESFFSGGLLPYLETQGEKHVIVDPITALQALIATTFSVAGALYQAYLVKEKGWSLQQIRSGSIDSVFGITVLVGITALILCTSATTLHNRIQPDDLKSANDVAAQLKDSFGKYAYLMFSIGIFAGAFSSFLVNAMIGGSVFADSIGKGEKVDSTWTKHLTIVALLFGMLVAIASSTFGKESTAGLIIFAQALTVIGNPVLAGVILYLAHQARRQGRSIPTWLFVAGYAGMILVTILAFRTGIKINLDLMSRFGLIR